MLGKRRDLTNSGVDYVKEGALSMTKVTGRVFCSSMALCAMTLLGSYEKGSAQQPTQAQIAAMRSACPSDYRKY